MKKVRLFEIGFKMKPHSSSYTEKFNVVADDAGEAEEKARAFMLQEHIEWWEEEGEEMEKADMEAGGEKPTVPALAKTRDEYLDEIRNYSLCKLLDVGTTVV